MLPWEPAVAIAGLAAGKPQRQAAIDAGVPAGGADSFAQRTLKNEQVKSTLRELLVRKDLSEENLAEAHAESLRATKVVAVRWREGDSAPDIVEAPDFATRLRAANDGWRLFGVPEHKTAQDENDGRIIVYVTPEKKRLLEHIRGSPLPPGSVIELSPEGAETTPGDGAATPALPAPSDDVPKAATDAVEQTPEVPPWPAANRMLNADQAVEQARLRGEPEATVNMFGTMKSLGLVIDGATFKRLCSLDKPAAASDATGQ